MNVEEDMIDTLFFSFNRTDDWHLPGQLHEIQTFAILPKIVLRIFYIY